MGPYVSLPKKILSAAAKSRSAYDTINSVLIPSDLGVVYEPIWQAVADYYARDAEAANCDSAFIIDRISGGGNGDKKQNQLRALCEDALSIEVSAANVADYLRDYRIDTEGMRLAACIAGRKPREEIEGLARSYVDLLSLPDTCDTSAEVLSWAAVLRKRLDNTGRIKISPKCLNDRLGGGVFPGTNLTIVARPELGKSALALTIACGFARRGLRGLYLTNEDAASVLMLRAACNLTNKTEVELTQEPDNAEREAIAKGAANLRVIDISPGTPAEIEGYIKAANPVFVVIDQIRNLRMKGGSAAGTTEKLDAAAQFVREMGKKYNLITVGTTQAGDSASGKLVLDMSDIADSKTGIPGAADVLIMIGADEQLKNAQQRMLNLPKNKVTARHEFWQVGIDQFRSKYRSLSSC